jgi:hypothetical protein
MRYFLRLLPLVHSLQLFEHLLGRLWLTRVLRL